MHGLLNVLLSVFLQENKNARLIITKKIAMGTSAAGIILNKSAKKINESIDFVFGNGFQKVSYCDSRIPNCVYAGVKENILTLINSDLSERFFSVNQIEDKILSFFENPEIIFVFEEYDSGASYGYAIFKNGKLERKLRAINYDDIIENYGNPDEDELEWLSGTETKDTDGSLLLKNSKNGHEIPIELKYKAILQLLMENKFGFHCETMDDIFTESGHFAIIENSTENPASSGTIKNSGSKKWWKLC